ncbi:MAG: HigA family addiction module antidote protein [bacterium]|nr:HigA family addiction module antidote protein [bacterium]
MPIKKGSPPHPGRILKMHFLDLFDISIKSLADEIGESTKTVSDIANELSYITPDIALKLSDTFDTTPDYWISLQTNHDLWRAKDGDRGTDNPFYTLMRVCGEAILKLIGVESPADYIARAVVLKEKNLYPDIMAVPSAPNWKDLERVFIEFQGYLYKWIQYSLAAKMTMACAHDKYDGPVLGTIIYTDRKYKEAALPLSLESLSGSYWLKGQFREIVLPDYSDEDIMKVDPRLVALAPFTVPDDLPREKLKERCGEWNKIAQQLFTDDAYQNILQIMMSFFLDKFKDLSIEEVKTMWHFDLAKTKAGQQLYSMGDKNGEKRGIKRGKIENILEEIDRIQTLRSNGAMTDSLYKELIEPLQTKLAMLETVATRGVESGATGSPATS